MCWCALEPLNRNLWAPARMTRGPLSGSIQAGGWETRAARGTCRLDCQPHSTPKLLGDFQSTRATSARLVRASAPILARPSISTFSCDAGDPTSQACLAGMAHRSSHTITPYSTQSSDASLMRPQRTWKDSRGFRWRMLWCCRALAVTQRTPSAHQRHPHSRLT